MVRESRASACILGALAFFIAAISAKPYAGSWNDGSRLAVVESLLDRGTLAIDDSIFCKPPQHLVDAGRPPIISPSPVCSSSAPMTSSSFAATFTRINPRSCRFSWQRRISH